MFYLFHPEMGNAKNDANWLKEKGKGRNAGLFWHLYWNNAEETEVKITLLSRARSSRRASFIASVF
jgi:hypothetical protein